MPTALSSGAQKLGQPVPLSNLVSEENRARSQPAQPKVPSRCSSSSGLVNGRSVAACRSTAYWVGRQQLAPFRVGVRDFERLGARPRVAIRPATKPIAVLISRLRLVITLMGPSRAMFAGVMLGVSHL